MATVGTISERVVVGSRTMFFIPVTAVSLTAGDTVDLSPYCSVVENAWFTPTTAVAHGRTLSGTGNVTFTFVGTGTGIAGTITVVGTP